MTTPDPNTGPAAGGGPAGQDNTTGQQPAGAPAVDSGGDSAGADALGDAGKRALDAMKAERNTARKLHTSTVDALAQAFGRTPEQIRDLVNTGRLGELAPQQQPTDTAGGAADVQRQIADAQRSAAKAAADRIIRAELKAAAAGRLADPSDIALIERMQFTVGEDGEVDAEEIRDAIDELLRRKPHLAAQRGPTFGSADAGVRNGSNPGQLGEADLKRMTPQQIVEAHDKGQLADLLGA